MSNPIRALIPSDSQDAQTLQLALGYAQEIARKEKVQDVLLVTHAKAQLQHTGLATALGAPAVKALLAGRPVALASGAALRHGTMATLRYASGRPVIIAYYADEKLLDFVDGMAGVKGVVAVPWVPGEADRWRERWNPLVHGEERRAPAAIIDDAVVETALRSVSTIINLSHSMLQARDRQWIDETLRVLRAKGHALDAAAIRTWAIRNGWKPGAADDLAKLAQKVGGLKAKPRLTGIHNADGRYARWAGGEA